MFAMGRLAGRSPRKQILTIPETAHKETDQSEHKSIERSEIWGALLGTIGDEQLLLEQQ
jgi:hypothetical protein